MINSVKFTESFSVSFNLVVQVIRGVTTVCIISVEITEISPKLIFTEILAGFIKIISGSEIVVKFIFDPEMIIFGSFDPK